jgi:hypothetical protein
MYLSGVIRPELVGMRPDLGVIVTPHMGNRVDLSRTSWGADNGCFARPEAFDLGGYLAWLKARLYATATCLFATAPDVVGDAKATWERSLPVLPLIRALGIPAAFVAQDGAEAMDLDWDAFDVLFIGGSTQWKLSHHAKVLTRQAKAHGKPVHMGRVNSLTRMQTAAMWGCDSCDGTYLAFGPDVNTPRLLAWLDSLHREPVLNFGRTA